MHDLEIKKTKLLIVDDDELSNITLKSLLETILDNKYEIKSLFTGNDVLEEIENNRYQIVILDEKLPGMSGIKILEEIKRKDLKTNVIFLTGYGEEIIEKAKNLGAVDFISKGEYDLGRLIDIINNIQ